MRETLPTHVVHRVNRALVFLGAALIASGLRFFVDPSALAKTAIGHALPGIWDDAWSACYVLGGVLIVAGVALRRPRLELPGVTITITAILVNGGAIVVVAGTAGFAQLPLYALALWVLEGRLRDLLDLRYDRRGDAPDPRPPDMRVERRLNFVAIPAVVIAVLDPTTLLVALLGGGLVTAISQAFLYKPTRRSLDADYASKLTQAGEAILDRQRTELAEAYERIEQLEAREGELEARCDALERTNTELLEHLRVVDPTWTPGTA